LVDGDAVHTETGVFGGGVDDEELDLANLVGDFFEAFDEASYGA
jgi:hypothetical protein